jgi:hypothetical protein
VRIIYLFIEKRPCAVTGKVLNVEEFDEYYNKNSMSSPNANCMASGIKIGTSNFIPANTIIITYTKSICVSFFSAGTV